MDATCYHMGAPLLHGDVEDVPGHGACITCPWHHYQISMTTGERLYQDMTKKTCALPKKQRVHETKTSADAVLVRLSGGGKPPSPPPGTPRPKPHELPKPDWESDRYAFKAPPPSQGRGAAGGRGRGAVRSGHALRAFAAGGLHPGLRGAPGVGEMVARSMRGGDGKAPWAMSSVSTVSSRAREDHESVFAEKTEEALPSPPREKKKRVVAYPSYKIVRHTRRSFTLFRYCSLLLSVTAFADTSSGRARSRRARAVSRTPTRTSTSGFSRRCAPPSPGAPSPWPGTRSPCARSAF